MLSHDPILLSSVHSRFKQRIEIGDSKKNMSKAWEKLKLMKDIEISFDKRAIFMMDTGVPTTDRILLVVKSICSFLHFHDLFW
jgi:hypothetical protein